MIEIVVGVIGAAATLVGMWFGAWLSRRQQRADAAVAEREQRLAQMQALVVAVSEMMTARTLYEETWLSRTTRWRVAGMAVIEFWAAWRVQGGRWESTMAALAPSARVIEGWQRRSIEEAAALAPYAARVAAAGLPLGMADDPELAAAAQKLLDACLENQGEAAVQEAIAGLRTVFYGQDQASSAS
ncbi:hypothetical protein [Streptomyces odonnellii]|uniref:hypothetical protein n=1 Tax=Streptomyces odonnellii TaxID=1417980 RepID=UPI0012FF4C51|nr:hypothetical protein [Streptomyces odonnellii]